jgi:hypothetical protein
MGFPYYKENIQYLLDNSVQYLISLTAEIQPPVTDFQGIFWYLLIEQTYVELDIPLFYEVNNTNLIIEGNEDYNALLNIKRQLFKNILGRSVNSV